MTTKKKSIISILTIIGILIIDAIIKIVVLINSEKLPIIIIENTFSLVYYENVMEGLLTFVISYFIVFFIVARFMIKKREKNTLKVNIALAMILGGGIGNVVDAIIGGSITDYLQIANLPIMNLDDIIMIIGCILFVIFIIIDIVKKDNTSKVEEKFEK